MQNHQFWALAFLFSLCAGALVAQNSLDFLQYRSLGPERGGRVTAVAGTAAEVATFYLGATGGGLWKTEDYGTSWKNISDGAFASPSIGAIAVEQSEGKIIYVGTGTDGLRSNVIVGKGVYKSDNSGRKWVHLGLEKVGQIGALIIDPNNVDRVFVAAIGQPFNANPERGIYRTLNGGKSWEQVLFLSDSIGFSDIEFLPGAPNTLLATAWKAERKPWTIISGGTAAEGGIYRSTDGGNSWTKTGTGLPSELIGKIDVAVCPSDPQRVYALVEAPAEQGGLYRSDDSGQNFRQISSIKSIRTRPFYYTNIRVDPKNADIVYSLATSYHRSNDGGENWVRIRSPHGDNHDMWINPDNPELFIQANDGGANVTHNGGKTWSTQFNQNTAEIYQVEVDDQYPYWLYGGQQDNYTTIAVPSLIPDARQVAGLSWIINTGGCETGPAVPKPGNHNIVYSNCKGRFGVFDKRTGQERSYYVGASNIYGHNPADLKFRFQRVSPIHVSPHDPTVVYHASQYVHRSKDEGQNWEIISPDLTAFEADKQVISGSPITRDITGEEFYSTIYSLRESPITPGLLWVGANDGPVHVSQDHGENWEEVTPEGLPPGGRVDAVAPSPHDPAKAYIAVLRYQLGDFHPYLYRTTDYGKSWTFLSGDYSNLPGDCPTRVVREDPIRPGLLYAGTECGLFISWNDGMTWSSFQQNLPLTPVTDIQLHRGDMVLSTMGRGFWVLDNLAPLRDMALPRLPEEVKLFTPATSIRYRSPKVRDTNFPRYPRAGVDIDYYLPRSHQGVVILEIRNSEGRVIQSLSSDSIAQASVMVEDMGLNLQYTLLNKQLKNTTGLHRFRWDMSQRGPWDARANRRYKNGPMAAPGTYSVHLITSENRLQQSITLEMDPRMEASGVSAADVMAQTAMQQELVTLLTEVRLTAVEWDKELQQLNALDHLKRKEISRREQLDQALQQLQSDSEIIYAQPMLIDQIRYLYFMLNGADQRPGQDMYDRLEELKVTWKRLQESIQ